MSEMKNAVKHVNTGLDQAEGGICEHTGMLLEINQ